VTPVKALAVSVAVNVALKVALMGPLAQVGLALATAVGAWVNLSLLVWFAARQRLIVLDARLVRAICAELDRRLPDAGGPRARLIHFVTDRPGHDFRYEIDPSRTEAALAWTAPHDFETGLARTVDWYLAHREWWQSVRAGRYAGQRLGTAA